jgi:hypothetical protein
MMRAPGDLPKTANPWADRIVIRSP